MPQIADTGFLVACWNGDDAHHEWARGIPLRAPLLTCEAVLTEAAYLLGTAEPLLRMLLIGDIIVDFDLTKHAPPLVEWLAKYDDIDPGLADACVVRMADVQPRHEVLTTDRRDFSIYRTLSGKPLKCVFPAVK